MPDLPLTAGCLCGAVRFEVTARPEAASYCHCTRCQRRTGTAAAPSTRVPHGAVRIVAGEDQVRVWFPPDHGFGKAFCATCGSALWSQDPDDPDVKGVRMGAFDEDPGIPFTHRQFTDFAATWEPIPDDGLPHYGGRRPST